MGLNHKDISGVKVCIDKKQKILEYIKKYLRNTKNQKPEIQKKSVRPLIIFTPNPEIITYAQKNENFRKTVNSAQINLPDGAGTVWALKKLYNLRIDRLSGADFMTAICRLAAGMGFRVGLIGGKQGVALETAECLHRYHKNLKIHALGEPEVELRITNYESGDLNQESGIKNQACLRSQEPEEIKSDGRFTKKSHDSVLAIYNSKTNKKIEKELYFKNLVKKIIKSKIDIFFVGLGFPKQEWFIQQLSNEAMTQRINRALIFMGVGGAFDYISGRVPRAPVWMRERGLEWAYRLIRQPQRIKRQLMGVHFFLDVLRKSS